MKHLAVHRFSELYGALPVKVRKMADHNFSILKEYPNHPMLRMMKSDRVWSMRIGSRYRALAVEDGNHVIWFWIGKYQQYSILFS